MTRQLISNTSNHLLRSSHAQRPPQSGIVQVRFEEVMRNGTLPKSVLLGRPARVYKCEAMNTARRRGPKPVGCGPFERTSSDRVDSTTCEDRKATLFGPPLFSALLLLIKFTACVFWTLLTRKKRARRGPNPHPPRHPLPGQPDTKISFAEWDPSQYKKR